MTTPLRVGSRIGKYRLDRRIGVGGFASVYAATDTLLGIKVALKIPRSDALNKSRLDELRREARLTMQLDHPNILPIRDASVIDDHFVIVTTLGDQTLADRLRKRIGFDLGFDLMRQLLAGVTHAHENGVIHCDIKPENILLFSGTTVRLTDFGIAKVAQKTVEGAGTGTLGYMAPEQAMGKPSKRSDVFSIGLIGYRLFSGHWPEYPFEWPLPGAARLRRRSHPDLIAVLRQSLSTQPRKRYADAGKMLAAWDEVRLKAIRFSRRHRISN